MRVDNFHSRRDFLYRTTSLGVAVWAGAVITNSNGKAAADAHASNQTWQIGCYTRPWAKYDYRTAFDAIVEAGMKYVGLMTSNSTSGLVISVRDKLDHAVRVGEEAQKRGLEILSLYGGEIDSQNRDSATTDLRHLIDLSVAARAKTVLLGGISDAGHYDAYFGAVADCCDYAKEKKIGLTIKPHGGLNATGTQLHKAIKKVGRENFTIWYDAGNILFYSDAKVNPVEDAATLGGMVTGWCIKDYRHPKQVDVTPGDGQVDFPAVFAKLKQGGFVGGPLLIETLTSGELPQLLTEARKARQFLDNMICR